MGVNLVSRGDVIDDTKAIEDLLKWIIEKNDSIIKLLISEYDNLYSTVQLIDRKIIDEFYRVQSKIIRRYTYRGAIAKGYVHGNVDLPFYYVMHHTYFWFGRYRTIDLVDDLFSIDVEFDVGGFNVVYSCKPIFTYIVGFFSIPYLSLICLYHVFKSNIVRDVYRNALSSYIDVLRHEVNTVDLVFNVLDKFVYKRVSFAERGISELFGREVLRTKVHFSDLGKILARLRGIMIKTMGHLKFEKDIIYDYIVSSSMPKMITRIGLDTRFILVRSYINELVPLKYLADYIDYFLSDVTYLVLITGKVYEELLKH